MKEFIYSKLALSFTTNKLMNAKCSGVRLAQTGRDTREMADSHLTWDGLSHYSDDLTKCVQVHQTKNW